MNDRAQGAAAGNPRAAGVAAAAAPAAPAAAMGGATKAGPATDGPVAHRGLITVSVMLATVMQVLDTTIANVALPSMQTDLGASPDTINWVLTSYIVAAAIATPLTGWVADQIGRKRLFLVSIIGFVLASVLCGLSWNLGAMVAFRLMQGVFGAAIVPLSQTFMLDINPPEKQGQAMAMWGAGIMVGPIIGPTLGGWLTENFDWRWVFFINVPVGIVALLGSAAYLPERAPKPRYFDVFGFAFLALGIGALQMMLDRGAELDWFSSTEVWVELGLALIGLWVAVMHFLTAARPFIEPRIFANRNFSIGLVMIFVVGMVLMASMALLPPLLARIYGFPVLTVGMIMAPRGMGTMVIMLIVGRLLRFIDPRLLIAAGLMLTATSMHMMSGFSPLMGSEPVIFTGVVQGMGMGLVFVPLSSIAFATMEPSLRADGTALFSLMRNIGSSIGISILGYLLTRNAAVNHVELIGPLTANNPDLGRINAALGGGADAMGAQVASVLDGIVTKQALMIAYNDDFLTMMWMCLAVIPLIALLRRPPQAAR